MLRESVRFPLLLMIAIPVFWSAASSAYDPGYRERGGVVGGAVRGAIIGGIVGGGDSRAVRNGAAIGAIAGGVRRERYNWDHGGYPEYYRSPYRSPYRY